MSKLIRILKTDGITQKQLASALNVTQKTVSIKLRKENWKISDAEIIRVFLNRDTIDELFFTRKNPGMG